jgi:hypothetical protein
MLRKPEVNDPLAFSHGVLHEWPYELAIVVNGLDPPNNIVANPQPVENPVQATQPRACPVDIDQRYSLLPLCRVIRYQEYNLPSNLFIYNRPCTAWRGFPLKFPVYRFDPGKPGERPISQLIWQIQLTRA